MYSNFSQRVTTILKLSREEAIRLGHDFIGVEHILLAIIKSGDSMAVKLLNEIDVDLVTLSAVLEDSMLSSNTNLVFDNIPLTKQTERVLQYSIVEAKLYKSDIIGSEHLLLAIIKENNTFASKALTEFNASYDSIKQKLDKILNSSNSEKSNPPPISAFISQANKPKHKDKEHHKTPVLDNFSRDLTKMAANGKLDPVIGREKEIERVSQILSRRKKNNPVLIGEPGVGKTAIIEGLAIKIVEKKTSRSLFDKRLLSLDLAAIVAGTKYRGQFEERMRTILLELEKSPNIILFVDEIHTLVGAGSASGSLDASNMFKPSLARGEVQCIGATTVSEYRQYIEKDGALERRFQKILVEEPSVAETQQIIESIKDKYECYHNVKFSTEAINSIVRYADRYISDRMFPDKAIDILDETGARVHISNIVVPNIILELEAELENVKNKKNEVVKQQLFEDAAKLRNKELKIIEDIEKAKIEWDEAIAKNMLPVTEYDVSDVVAMMTGIPVNKIAENESQKLLRLSEELKQFVIGQDEAIDKLAQAIRRARAGLKNPKRPIGSFMFLGPTGVGKTELAKVLARTMFDKDDAIIRIDMSEFMERHNVSRLIGATPGYIGYEEGGQLTEKVRKRPYSVILFDEIEKAHPDVLNILLQVFDDGILTDGSGRTIDFRNTIIIMTSNAGTKDIKAGGKIGFSELSNENEYENMKNTIENTVKQLFNPEFVNRIDEFIIFKQLEKEQIYKIINLNLKDLIDRLAINNITLELSDKAKEFIVNEGFDKKYGARPLRKQIQKHIENPLSEEILADRLIPFSKVYIEFNEIEKKMDFIITPNIKQDKQILDNEILIASEV